MGWGVIGLIAACGPDKTGKDEGASAQDSGDAPAHQCPKPLKPVDHSCGDGQHQAGEVCWGASRFFELPLTDVQPYATQRNLVVVDANGDGHLDLGTGDRFVMGDGEGGAKEIVAGNWSVSGGASLIDFDDDGVLDFAWRSTGKSVFLARGGETFPEDTHYVLLTEDPQDLVVGDFDGDGVPDLIVGYELGPEDSSKFYRLAWLRGLGQGEFEEIELTVHAGDALLRAGQLFGAPATDLFTSGYWYEGGPGGLESVSRIEYGLDPNLTSPHTADLTCDGRDDLFEFRWVGEEDVFIAYVQQATGGFSLTHRAKAPMPTPDSEWIPWDAADLNHDGATDLLLTLDPGDDEPEAAYVAYATGDGTFGTPIALETEQPWFAVKAVDFNDDGTMDIAGVRASSFGPPDSGIPTIYGGIEVVFQEP